MQLTLVFTTATLAVLASTTSGVASVRAGADASTALNISSIIGVQAAPPYSDNHGQHRRLCVCWGACCSHCHGWECPQRLLKEVEDKTEGVAGVPSNATVVDVETELPLVWANAGPNDSPVQCKQRSWGLECPPLTN